jgi:hypothetical protein
MKLSFKKWFTMIELMIVIMIMGTLSVFWLNSLAISQIKQKYDIGSYKIVQFIKKARIASMSNFTEYNKNWTSSSKYLIPNWWYWVEIEKHPEWKIILKYFYNKNNNSKFDSGDVIIEEWKSRRWNIYIYNIEWNSSDIAFPYENIRENVSNQSKVTIIFRNFTWKYPNNGSVFITSWKYWNVNIKDLKISFYMFFNEQKLYKRRILFDRISKIITLQSCKKSNNTLLDSCNDSGWKKWVLNF